VSGSEACVVIICFVPAIERRMAVADRRARELLGVAGRELRAARVGRGLSQRSVAAAAEVSQSRLSKIERSVYPAVRFTTLARLAAGVGLELSLKFYPGGQPIRDRAHVALLASLRERVGDAWAWRAEVPFPADRDPRAWDRMLTRGDIRIGIEAETRPTDLQELQRRLALKKRDGGVGRLLLVLSDTRWNRALLAQNDLSEAFPVSGRDCLDALRRGRDPGGDAVLLLRPRAPDPRARPGVTVPR
jgi:transcriptional regulator with XRE-family HTH domain